MTWEINLTTEQILESGKTPGSRLFSFWSARFAEEYAKRAEKR